MCAVITSGTPAAIAAAKGTSSADSKRSIVPAKTGRSRCGSTAASPCPGKCLAQESTPPRRNPRSNAAPILATRLGSEPKLRSLVTGLSGLTCRSSMGAKLRLHPTARSSVAIARADLLRGFDVPQPSQFRSRRPRRERLSKRKTRPAFLIDSDQHRASGGLADCQSEFSQPLRAREIALVKNNSRKAASEIFREFAGKGIAVEAQHESCKYGITRLRFGLGVCIHLV